MSNIVINIPCISSSSGGIKRMLRLLEQLYIRGNKVHLHSDMGFPGKPNLPCSYSSNDYDNIPSEFRTVISYSDNPHIGLLIDKFGYNTLVYQLSFGMEIIREGNVVAHPKTTILTSTKKIKKECEEYLKKKKIKKKIYTIGFALDECCKTFTYDKNIEKEKNTCCLLYHRAEFKNTEFSIKSAYKKKLKINTFGNLDEFDDQRIYKAYHLPNQSNLKKMYHQSEFFISGSLYEGLNMCPLESTLCGTPSIIMNGCEELYKDDITCLRVGSNKALSKAINHMKDNAHKYNDKFRINMEKIVKKYTWEKVINNLERWI